MAPAIVFAPLVTGVARAGDDHAAPAALRQLNDAGVAFENARVLDRARRVAALEETELLLQAVPQGALPADARGAAALLAGAIRYEMGDPARAEEAFGRATKGLSDGDFADDAAFARIQALEAAGKDVEAAKEWPKWEARFKTSPLLPEARLAAAWNAMRRGKVSDAEKLLASLVTAAPWAEKDARVGLARATAAYLAGRPAEAASRLGTTNSSSATYLRGLCYTAQGNLLKAAASFQEVADRDPNSPLRDPALFAKANAFLSSRAFRSAAEEFARLRPILHDEGLKAEDELRAAASVQLSGSPDSAVTLLRGVVAQHAGTDVAARAQFLVGECLRAQKQYSAAIPEYNRVLTSYFQHEVAASAQYRVARCLDALGARRSDERLSGRCFRLCAVARGSSGSVPCRCRAPRHEEAARRGPVLPTGARSIRAQRQRWRARLRISRRTRNWSKRRSACWSWLITGPATGQLSGAPHLLQKMPPSRSEWARLCPAHRRRCDGGARTPSRSASRARAADARVRRPRNRCRRESAARPGPVRRRGRDSLAIATEERMLAKYASRGDGSRLASAYLHMAHSRFNQKKYHEAAAAYEEYVRRFPSSSERLLALYQAGLCYRRLERAGDAVDRWETIVRDSATSAIAERAWARAGDTYFQAERYSDAKRCYTGLLQNFATSRAAGIAALRLAQCEYNAGNDAGALAAFAEVSARFPDSPYAQEASRGSELSLYRLGQKPDGRATLQKLVEQYPTSSIAADVKFQIARQLYDAKRWGEAAEALRRTVTQFPSSPNADRAQYLLAECHTRAGDLEQARQVYEQFLTFFPASPLRPTVQTARNDALRGAGACRRRCSSRSCRKTASRSMRERPRSTWRSVSARSA